MSEAQTPPPADAALLGGMADICDRLGPMLAPYGASLTRWQDVGASLRALAAVLAPLTPEVVAEACDCLRHEVGFARSVLEVVAPEHGATESKRIARLEAAVAALARLAPPSESEGGR